MSVFRHSGFVIALVLITVHRLPAPISEVETPTPPPNLPKRQAPSPTASKPGPQQRVASSNTGYDGVWVGTETILQPFTPKPKVVRTRTARIIIAQGGTLLAIAEGHCPGRYANISRFGNSLQFEAGDCKLRVTVSTDGKTLTESGTSTAAITMMSTVPRGPVQHKEIQPVEITGEFHRE